MAQPTILRQDARHQAITKTAKWLLGITLCVGIGLGAAGLMTASLNCTSIAQKTVSNFVSASMPKLVKLPFSS